MIIGIGSDLIDIRRVEKSLERFGERFTERCFTEIERAKSDGRRNRAASYAKRFALRRPVPRRSARGWRRVSSGRTWASSTCRAASRPCG